MSGHITTYWSRPYGAAAGNPVKQNTVVAECCSSRIYARAECNRNFGEGGRVGGKTLELLGNNMVSGKGNNLPVSVISSSSFLEEGEQLCA